MKGWLERGSGSFVRYYKKVGESNSDTTEGEKSLLTSKDFVLVLQSETQAEIHKENPRILCADSTHGVTGYLFYLLSLLVINRFGVGFIIAWAICSKENALVWEILARSLRPVSLRTNPEVFMSDDDNSAWNGLIRVFVSLLHKLLCHWHIKKNVRQHCFGSKSKLMMIASSKHNGTAREAGAGLHVGFHVGFHCVVFVQAGEGFHAGFHVGFHVGFHCVSTLSLFM